MSPEVLVVVHSVRHCWKAISLHWELPCKASGIEVGKRFFNFRNCLDTYLPIHFKIFRASILFILHHSARSFFTILIVKADSTGQTVHAV